MTTTISLETVEARASYGIGRQMGDQLARNGFEDVELAAVIAGLEDAFTGQDLKITAEQIQEAFTEISRRMREAEEARTAALVEEGKQFLIDNGTRDEVVVLDSGLQYEVLEAGDAEAEKATRESTVKTHYHGTFINGQVFDSSYQRGQPIEFPVTGVIKGWTEALQLMNPGAKWRLYVPYHLAYGEQGSPGGIPPYSTLIFDVELIEVR
ncbi:MULTISPECIES: FKBP-type peptidyl-prolyl cis-trans isomerase [Nitrincola]|uniref:Peptidyl-prolyl cis-trans isomerase n=1 Tax=Nitrincola nitratireducens TaxID=1229521 RepID=W9VGU1_9GAMM|nr:MULTISPECIES: FKBP-type peptidyl-prolyl cis-trans isomerase [Nitrincola]EXJ09845.1 FKBP-type 22 kDa peptidyl-prolyl cis-trans isomerase [Nitrincola nitratireducens]